MPITQETPMAVINAQIDALPERAVQVIINTYITVGEQCLKAIRTSGSYTDQTGNLRSSTGYVISVDGELVHSSSFEPAGKGTDGVTGASDGRAFAESLVSRFPRGVCLIFVAGMNYAVHVSNRGYSVLDAGELQAKGLVRDLLKQTGFTLT